MLLGWPRPLNRGGRLIEGDLIVFVLQKFRDMLPSNRGWPLNGGPLNRGSTVVDLWHWSTYSNTPTCSKTHKHNYFPIINNSFALVAGFVKISATLSFVGKYSNLIVLACISDLRKWYRFCQLYVAIQVLSDICTSTSFPGHG